jgi:two-component system response regulator AlgR
LKVLIVDDERLARARLRRLLEQHQDLQIIGEAGNGVQALEQNRVLHPDLIFLDIRMPGLDGIAVANALSEQAVPPAIIFVTAFHEHALEAFATPSVDYLLKPIQQQRLTQALDKLRRPNRAQLAQQEDQDPDHFIQAGGANRRTLIPLRDIYYLQSDQKYTRVRHSQGEDLIELSLKSLENRYPDQFLRVHRNALVAVRYLRGIELDADGQHYIYLRDLNERIPVSRRLVASIKRTVAELSAS